MTDPFLVPVWRGHRASSPPRVCGLPHGEALAHHIDGARLVVIPGMGHGVPPRRTWDQVVPEVVAHVRSVEAG